jgi:hypothetical protein
MEAVSISCLARFHEDARRTFEVGVKLSYGIYRVGICNRNDILCSSSSPRRFLAPVRCFADSVSEVFESR